MDELILIGDFGGGTSDFCILRVGPTLHARGRRPGDVLGVDRVAIAECVDRVMTTAGVRAEEIDRVFLTGGSSFVPAVRRILTDRFGTDKMTGGSELTSVATGLAPRAAEQWPALPASSATCA